MHTRLGRLCCGLGLATQAVWAEPALLSVDAFRKQQGPGHFRVEGYGHHGFECPPCPPGAQCEPCAADFFVVSDRKERCPYELGLPYPSRGFSSKDWSPGTRVTVDVQVRIDATSVVVDRPEDRAAREKSADEARKAGTILNDSLRGNPALQPAPRPKWLRDIPGESYSPKKR